MDIQKLVDAINAHGERDRANYHLTLGEIIEAANAAIKHGCDVIKLDAGGFPGKPKSYRGYYFDLAFSQDGDGDLEVFSATIRGCLGFTFTGFKGGDFTMHEKTPLWVSEYGDCSGVAIVGSKISGSELILQTKQVD